MKRFSSIILLVIPFIFNGCKKDNTNRIVIVPVIPSISIQTVNYPSFINSTWTNVIGGQALFQYDLLNASGAVSTTTKDSTNLSNISSYSKILTTGTYDIYVSSKNQTTAVDTFIRFNAQIKALSVSGKQALSLTATTNDGLITIGQSFVKNNTIPTFKPDSGATSYKFGIVNGFYYLYVKGGTKGTVNFTAKAGTQTEVVSKNLNIITLNQYNLAIQTNKSTLQVIFVPFAYNQVAVSSSTLLTVNINTGDYYVTNSNVYFVATDESGNVLNSIKYVQGTTTFKFSATAPYEKDRFNFFVILIPTVSTFNPSIKGFLQVKKGSTYTNIIQSLPQKATFALKPHLKNATGFDDLWMSTNTLARDINLLSDSTVLQQLIYPADSTKLFVKMLKNNQYTYNFFNIPTGASDLNVDLSQVTETPLIKSIMFPTGSQPFAVVYAKTNVNYYNAYVLGGASILSNQATIYYPSETFPEYDLMMGYFTGNFGYYFTTSGTTIPSQAPTFNASFSVAGSDLTNFVPSTTGTFDYYHATFLNRNSGSNFQVDLYSPSAANYTKVKLPDFSTYPGLSGFNLSAELLNTFELEQYNGFNEQHFTYKDVNAILSYPGFNCSDVRRDY